MQTNRSFKLFFSFNPETSPSSKQNIKVEINIKETFSILKRSKTHFSIESDWFTGSAQINTFQLEELLATKLRALYQRSKGRDVFDLWLAINNLKVDIKKVVTIFEEYMKREGATITRTLFEKNLELKLKDSSFLADITALLSPELSQSHSSPMLTEDGNSILTNDKDELATEGWNLVEAANEIKSKILVHLSK